MKGIDVSENNGAVDWQAVADAGYEFAIIRLGYGNRHLDECFYDNIEGARAVGLKIGVYYYDYGLDTDDAMAQAKFMLTTLADAELRPEDLEMGVWYDMEDADGWKQQHGMPKATTITNMCDTFVRECQQWGYKAGVYASYDWLFNKIFTEQLGYYTHYWVAEWGNECDCEFATLWQYSSEEEIDGNIFDGNEVVMSEFLN